MTEIPSLFKRCRRRLGYSVYELSVALGLSSARTLRRWESGEQPVHGTAWMVIAFMLRDREIYDLLEEVEDFVEANVKLPREHEEDKGDSSYLRKISFIEERRDD